MLTAAGQRKRNQRAGKCDVTHVPVAYQEILCDPQTSGGLLIAVEREQANDLLADIQTTDPDARLIGEVLPKQAQPLQMEVPE